MKHVQNIIEQSYLDITDDLEEISYLFSDNLSKLDSFTKRLGHVRKHLPPESLADVLRIAKEYRHTYTSYLSAIDSTHRKLKSAPVTEPTIMSFSRIVSGYRNILRTHQGILGSFITATDWQSPSFLHSFRSQAGSQTGKITGTVNDYKRDQHLDAQEYERLFLKEYIDSIFKLPIKVYATSSGMAAFTTILNYLFMEKKVKETVLIGRSIYFENKELVTKMFPDRIVEVEENDTHAIKKQILNVQPSVVMLDSLSNSTDISTIDLDEIITVLQKNVKTETYLVIDNTGKSVFSQPLKRFSSISGKITCITFESLNKYHQFGMDRVMGGIIYASGRDTGKLFAYREHLGTNIPDASVCSLPRPNRKLLEKRMKRHERNASLLATSLQEYISNNTIRTIEKIVYPGLSHHPSISRHSPSSFYGSYFVIRFSEKYRTINTYKRFVSSIIRESGKRNIDLVSGTSFGLNTTRIYLTATRTDVAEPFVRVSVGTENRLEIEAIKKTFFHVIEKM